MKKIFAMIMLLAVATAGCTYTVECGCKTKGACGQVDCPSKEACENCQCPGPSSGY